MTMRATRHLAAAFMLMWATGCQSREDVRNEQESPEDERNQRKLFAADVAVTSICREPGIDAFLRFGRLRLFRKGVVRFDRFDANLGFYRGPRAQPRAATWFEVVGTSPRWSARGLFSKHHRVSTWTRVVDGGREGLLARVEDLTPVVVDGEVMGIPAYAKVQTWLLWETGEREVVDATSSSAKAKTMGSKGERIYPQARQLRYGPAGGTRKTLKIEFERIAPYPKGWRSQKLAGPFGRMGFNMWDNAGRERAPELGRYVGYGIKVSAGGKQNHYSKATGLPSNLVSCALVTTGSTIWVGFYDAPPVRIDLTNARVTQLKHDGDPPKGISQLDSSRDYLWIGTFTEGLHMVRLSDNRGIRIMDIPDCRVNDLQVDRNTDDMVWVATSVGLYAIEPKAGETAMCLPGTAPARIGPRMR